MKQYAGTEQFPVSELKTASGGRYRLVSETEYRVWKTGFLRPGLVHEDVSAQSALQLLLQQRYVLRYTDRISMIRKRGILSD